MITSPRNPKLTLARLLQERRRREREGMFVTEGEDLLSAGRAAGCEPVHLLTAAGFGLGGEEVEPAALDSASVLGSGTRTLAVWELPEPPAMPGAEPAVCVYLHGVGDPGNVGTIVRSGDALAGATVVLGPDCADPYGPRALRATMGSIFARPPARGTVAQTPAPRAALLAHGGRPLSEGIEALLTAARESATGSGDPGQTQSALALTLCLGAERGGLPPSVLEHCTQELTIGLRPGGAESLNVAAVAAIALQRISSAAFGSESDG